MSEKKEDITIDKSLLKKIKEGNQLAFSIVYKRYASQAFSLSFKYLCNKQLAEDAVQNLFTKLWLKRHEIDESKPVNRYIFTILKNDLLNILRDSKNQIFVLEDCLYMLTNIEEEKDSSQFDEEQFSMINKAVELLPPQKRKIFDLKISGKYTNQEIADLLDISVNTVKFQYSQTLKQLREAVRGFAILLLTNYLG